MTKILVDTNTLIDGFDINQESTYILLSHTNRELEKHKSYGNEDLRYRSRKATRFIEENLASFEFDIKDYNVEFDSNLENDYVDNKIIQACLDNGYSLLTKDILLKHKAIMYGIDVVDDINDDKYSSQYSGAFEIELTDNEMSKFYQNINDNDFGVLQNQYLIIKNLDGEYVDKLKWNGHEFVTVKWKKISSRYLGESKPRNQKQEMLFNLLQDKNVTVKGCFGRFGSGKDYCMIAHALNLIESSIFEKLVFCRNQVPLRDAPESGFRKGDNFEKMIEFAMPLADAVGGVEMLRMMVEKGQVELQDLSRIRGRDIKNSIIYCTEFQNNSKEHAKLLLSRVGEGSQLWINGDVDQTDRDIFRSNSGISAITNLRGNRLYGQVTLDRTERSETASLSELI